MFWQRNSDLDVSMFSVPLPSMLINAYEILEVIKMVCIFCGRLMAGRRGTENWVCSFCMRDLAENLHGEETLGVKKVETDVADLKKEVDRIGDLLTYNR